MSLLPVLDIQDDLMDSYIAHEHHETGERERRQGKTYGSASECIKVDLDLVKRGFTIRDHGGSYLHKNFPFTSSIIFFA